MALTGNYMPPHVPYVAPPPLPPEERWGTPEYQQKYWQGMLDGTRPMRSSGDFMNLYQRLQDMAWNQTGDTLREGYAQLAAQTRQAIEMMNSRPRNEGIYLYGY